MVDEGFKNRLCPIIADHQTPQKYNYNKALGRQNEFSLKTAVAEIVIQFSCF